MRKLTEGENFESNRQSLVTPPMGGQDCTHDVRALRFDQLTGVLRKVIDKRFLAVGAH